MAEASFSGSSNLSATSPANSIFLNPANQINTVKLTDDNFLQWQLQIQSGICGLGLEAYLSEATPIPPQLISTETTPEGFNPLYATWRRQDQLLFSFLLASMADGIQGQIIGCTTSAQLWSRITRLFAVRSKARVMHYKLQLQTMKKGGQSMQEYC